VDAFPVEWALWAGVCVGALNLVVILSLVTAFGLALWYQFRNLERLVAMSISRRVAEKYVVNDPPSKVPPHERRGEKSTTRIESETKQAEAEMRARGLDPAKREDRLRHMEKAALRT